MWLTRIWPAVSKKNLNRAEAVQDMNAFASLEGDDGDRIIEHLCVKFKAFDTDSDKTQFKAGFDEGVRAVLIYMASQRSAYNDSKLKLEDR